MQQTQICPAPGAAPPVAHPSGPLDGFLAVSINRLAEITDFGRTFLYEEIAAGHLRLTKKGRRSVVLVSDALAWLNSDADASAQVPA